MFGKSNRSIQHAREFQRVKAGGYVWCVRRSALDDNFQKLLENPESHLLNAGKLPPGSRFSTNVASVSNFFLKRYSRARPSKLFKGIFRIAPAQRAFELACDLERVGILTPRVLAVAHKRVARVPLKSYLVTENLDGAMTLEQLEGDRMQAACDVALLVAQLHGEGFVHRDLNPTNIMFNRERRFLFVDLDTMRYIRAVPEHQALDDLARFSRKALLSAKISRSDRARFLKEYCHLRGFVD